MRTAVLITALLSLPVLAGSKQQVALPVGHSTTLSMPAPVSKVTVTNPSLVDVSQDGRRVTFVARAKGSTEAVVKTAQGEHRFRIYVAQDKYAMPY